MTVGRRVRSLRRGDAAVRGPGWQNGRRRRGGSLADGGAASGPGRPPEIEVPTVLDLLEAACAAGVSVPRALTSVGTAVGGVRGTAISRAGAQLTLGSRWPEAWSGAPAALAPVASALRASWEEGVAPVGALHRAAEDLRRTRHAQAVEAASRLGVHLVLPLGLCYLPAFVLVGLVPLLLSMASGVLGG